MRRVVFSPTATKELRRLPDGDRLQVLAKLDRYAEAGVGDVKAMRGRSGYRLRAGDYRVLFEADESTIEVKAVGHRRDTYN